MAKDDKEEYHRVVVMVRKDSHPEIFEELQRIKSHYRPERIRTLLTNYLNQQSQRSFAPPTVTPAGQQYESNPDVSNHEVQAGLEPPTSQEQLKQKALTEKKKHLSNNFQFD